MIYGHLWLCDQHIIWLNPDSGQFCTVINIYWMGIVFCFQIYLWTTKTSFKLFLNIHWLLMKNDDIIQICFSFTAYGIMLFTNVIMALSYMIIGGGSSAGVCFGLSILFCVLFTPCSFVCWYRPMYKAFRWEWMDIYMAHQAPCHTQYVSRRWDETGSWY